MVDLAATTDAVILVGGKGTRLRPLTNSIPKPMLPVAGAPFLEHLLARIKAAGMTHVVLGTSFKAEVFEEHFGDGSHLGLEIEYVVEDEPLGTGGGIRNVLDHLRYDRAMVFNGDVLGGTDLNAVLNTHVEQEAEVTLHLLRVSDPRAFGCVPTDADGRVSAFLEKTEDPPTDQINAGSYVFNRSVIEKIPAGRPVSVEREIFPGLLESGARVFGHVDQSYWRDMGTPADFVRGSSDLVRGIAPSPLLAGRHGESLVDESSAIAGGALLLGGTVIGRGVEIGGGARVEESVVFDGVQIEAGATVERCVIAAGVRIGARAHLVDCVIGEGAVIGARCELRDGLRVWPGVSLPDGGVRFSSDI
ncbi:sugar phosphate nucleotidyltransferase [Corynebacterium jeikeium]|uniref:Putative mannose-1-phosphate guanyltransferase n=1 Tax=Corynebacterium jeikeium (strain K411) TaxID=306537 RepID=Q4JTN7_CORJK|nr:NDP-sugar synthase [Corynebacterium jeikeium]EEW17190.1 nucleotidyl transferase [Corynebacterium jeikeium ATCC 43734]OOD31655.1 GDP-mannose pyrophosphorylase [Corynebacterium jeikeium]WCZ54300.1 D-glycero-alpha-D-manno-heptose 1-phosphate guanylyltransferase [Corynebacterium jeikeium]CAI37820.1 putative mannose-1-phosphate guanyltransferase [Corynebacterium jeikeium K411]SUY80395.1 mannose-1-phosphate guanylyltransferase [Corynebacterium jeikeium]